MVNYKIGDALKEGIALLNKNLIDTAGIDARVIMCSILKCDTLYLTVHRDDNLPYKFKEKFFALVKRRADNEPLSYILNTKEFMSLDFYVDENVLIPRPDTEILCEEIIKKYSGKSPVILDMCTGSGAIAVALAKYIPSAKVIGMDISSSALDIAALNAKNNGVSDRCSFILHDVKKPFKNILADCVVSNPPYIPSKDISCLDKNVKDYEPHIALDGGADGMIFYNSIVENISSCLKTGGVLAFEVGCGLAGKVKSLMGNKFDDVKVLNDICGIERVVLGNLMH